MFFFFVFFLHILFQVEKGDFEGQDLKKPQLQTTTEIQPKQDINPPENTVLPPSWYCTQTTLAVTCHFTFHPQMATERLKLCSTALKKRSDLWFYFPSGMSKTKLSSLSEKSQNYTVGHSFFIYPISKAAEQITCQTCHT